MDYKNINDDNHEYEMVDDSEAAEKEPLEENMNTSEEPESEPEPEKEPETDNENEYEFVQSFTSSEEEEKMQEPVKSKEHKNRSPILIIIIVILALALGICISALFFYNQSLTGNVESRTDGYTLEDATGSKMTVSEIADMNADAVVEITTESVVTDSWIGQYVTEGAGSGVIIDSDGYIITNYHVIENANSVNVKLHNGDSYDAEIIGGDSENDIAVLKVDSNKKLTAAKYGNSDQLIVGELAVVIGNPLGALGGTVTSGIISAKDRSVTIDGQKRNLLQTDASINPGNSGGGLFNSSGQLVGIVCAKSSGSDVEGLGFAIPINTAAEIAQKIIDKGGDITHNNKGDAIIGVNVLNITNKALMEQYNVNKQGVYITGLTSVNAQKAGFQIGDRFVKLGKTKISDYDTLSGALSKYAPGDKVKVIVERNGKKVTLETELVKAQKESSNQESSPFDGFPYN